MNNRIYLQVEIDIHDPRLADDVRRDMTAWILEGKDSYMNDREVSLSRRNLARDAKLGKIKLLENPQLELPL